MSVNKGASNGSNFVPVYLNTEKNVELPMQRGNFLFRSTAHVRDADFAVVGVMHPNY